jgi:hypothetical protein
MTRRNINRGFEKLIVWNDSVELYIITCSLLAKFPFELKKLPQTALMHRIVLAEILPKDIRDEACGNT